MLKIRYFTPTQLFKGECMDLENGMPEFFIMLDWEWDKKAKILTRDREWETVTGHRIKVPMPLFGALSTLEIDDSETTGSETKEILICKVPEGYLIGVYLY